MMINLVEHIEYLIRRHDCVVVPGFGAFIAYTKCAALSADGKRFMPPHRGVMFNPAINHNDGLMTNSLMRRHHLSYPTATDTLAACVEAMHARLNAVGSLQIGSLGSLTRQDEGTPLFTPFTSGNSADRYAHLPVLDITPILASKPTLKADEGFADEFDNDNAGSIWSRMLAGSWQVGRVAAAVAVIAICGVMITLGSRHNDNTTMAGLNSNLASNIGALIETATPSQDLYIAMPDPADGQGEYHAKPSQPAPAAIAVTAQPQVAAQTQTLLPRYILVVASLTSNAEAEKFIAGTGDNTLKVAAMGNRYRVYKAGAADKDTLVKALPAAQARYQGAWICNTAN